MDIAIHSSFEEIDIKQWQHLSDKSSVATFFQTHDCYQFYASLNFLQPFVFGVSESGQLKGIICGYIVSEGKYVKRFFSKRAIIPGGVLLDKNISESAFQALLSTCKKILKKRAIYVEIRNYLDFSDYKPSFINAGFKYQPHYDIHVDVSNESTLWNRILEEKRRQIRNSNTYCTITKEANSQDIKEFYSLLQNLYRHRVKRPLFAFDFFEKLSQNPFGKIVIVKLNDKVVGGMTMVVWNNVAYEWFVCGDDARSDIHASTYVTWAGLKTANQEGCKYFDFMGAGQPNKPYGVRNFKMRFGGNLCEYGRFVFVQNRLLYQIGKLYMWIKDTIC